MTPCRWKQYVAPKHCKPPTRLHGVITQKTTALNKQNSLFGFVWIPRILTKDVQRRCLQILRRLHPVCGRSACPRVRAARRWHLQPASPAGQRSAASRVSALTVVWHGTGSETSFRLRAECTSLCVSAEGDSSCSYWQPRGLRQLVACVQRYSCFGSFSAETVGYTHTHTHCLLLFRLHLPSFAQTSAMTLHVNLLAPELFF